MSYIELEMLANDEVPGPKLLHLRLPDEKTKQIQNTMKLIFLGTEEVKIGGYLSLDGTLVAYDLNKVTFTAPKHSTVIQFKPAA